MRRREWILAAAGLAGNGAAPLIGRWRSVTTTMGGIGAVYVFREGGVVLYSACALVESAYKLSGNQLDLGEQRVGVGWHADGRMQLNFGNGVLEDFARAGKVVDAVRPLLGEWRGTRVMEGRALPVMFQFREDGRSLLVVYLQTTPGQYQAAGAGWTMTVPRLPGRKITRDAGADTLTITVAGGDPHVFKRF